ncbi:hypothetical protein J4427_02980 [Candidatus Woesearchaeota archaeon]|nr:hypothetical protein [Candidatus Woesearchaeota archaeon]
MSTKTQIGNIFHNAEKKNQYDKFIHAIQQPKMKELWDNKEGEAWNNYLKQKLTTESFIK